MFSGKPRFVTNNFENVIKKKETRFIGEKIEMNFLIQANPPPQELYKDSAIDTKFSEKSNTIYKVSVKKIVSSEYDFRQHTLIIGNSQGNVTIVIEVEKERRNFGKLTFCFSFFP